MILHDFKPEKYTLVFNPNLTNNTVLVKENIELKCLHPSSKIVLHGVDVDIHSSTLLGHFENLKYSVDKLRQEITFILPKIIEPPNLCNLHIEFTVKINDVLHGIYKTNYNGHVGIATQFESTDARRAFICMDEPSAKSIFDISVIVPSNNLNVFSNMPIMSIKDSEHEKKYIHFFPTPLMSTYLVALILGNYDYISEMNGTTQIRICAPPDKIKFGEFALSVATRAITWYENYFDIKFPLPKCDLISIPDFPCGAMENFGCITFRETNILYNPDITTFLKKINITFVICHEIAHTWFGNMVTPVWWNDLWLNEGFANYIQYECVNALFPEWKIWDMFPQRDLPWALELDSLKSTHPIQVPNVETPEQIGEIFDGISYAKGCSLLVMLSNMFGFESFKTKIQTYLKAHLWGNTTSEKLWEMLGISSTMIKWMKEPGYPLITVNDDGSIHQERFGTHVSVDASASTGTKWDIPISYTFCEKNVLTTKQNVSLIDGIKNMSWFKLNPEQRCLYRVNYPVSNWNNLCEPIKNGTLSVSDRIGILSDAVALSRNREFPNYLLKNIIMSYSNESNYYVWNTILSSFNQLRIITHQSSWKSFVINFCKPHMKRLEQVKTNDLNMFVKQIVLNQLVQYGDEPISELNIDNYHDKIIPTELKGPFYISIAKTTNGFEYLTNRLKNNILLMSEEKQLILNALGTIHCQESLDFAFGSHVREQDSIFTLASMSSTHDGALISFDWMKKNWSSIVHKYDTTGLFGRIISLVGGGLYSPTEFKTFFSNIHVSCPKILEQTLENMEINKCWYERIGEFIW